MTTIFLALAVLATMTVVMAVISYNHRAVERLVSTMGAAGEPALCFYLEIDKERFHIINLVLENVGGGMAHEVTWETNPPVDVLANRGVQAEFLARGAYAQLAPRQKVRTFFGSSLELVHADIPPVELSTHCRSASGASVTAHFSLEPSQFKNITRVGETFENELLKQLKELNKSVEKAARGLTEIAESSDRASKALYALASPIDLNRQLAGSSEARPTPADVLKGLAAFESASSLRDVDGLLSTFNESEHEYVLRVLEVLAQDGYIKFRRMHRYIEITALGRAMSRQLDESPVSWKLHAQTVLEHLRATYSEENSWTSGSITASISLHTRAVQDAIALLADQGLVSYSPRQDGWIVRLTERGMQER